MRGGLCLTVMMLLVACQRDYTALYGGGDYITDLSASTFVIKQSSQKTELINFSKPEKDSCLRISEPRNPPPSVNHTQKEQGELTTVRKTQDGRPKETRTDVVEAEIDIGIIIDDSPSLKDNERQGIARALADQLATKLKGSHWRVHITGTSKGGTTRVGEVTWRTGGKKADKMYDYMVKVKDGRSKDFYNEVALYKARKLSNFFRKGDDNIHAYIIVSDEDMQCYYNDKFSHYCELGASFKRDYLNARSAAYGIIASEDGECGIESVRRCFGTRGDCSTMKKAKFKRNALGCHSDKEEKYNFKYDDDKKIEDCGRVGKHLNSCYKRDDDWQHARQAWLNSKLFTVTAEIGGNYDAIFKRIGDDVESKTLEIKIPAVPYKNSISLKDNKGDIDANSVSVKVNNRPVSNYSITGKTLTLKGDMPTVWPTDTELVVSYKLAAQKKRFELPQAQLGEVLITDSVRVYVDGSRTGFSIDVDVDVDGNKVNYVVLDVAPSPNTKVKIEASFLPTRYFLKQAKHRLPNDTTACFNLGKVAISGNADNDCPMGGGSITSDHTDDYVSFIDSQIKVGDTVRCRQMVDPVKVQADGLKVQLAETYVGGSVVLHIGSNSCDESQLSIEGLTIDIAGSYGCQMLASLIQNPDQDVRVVYKAYDPQNTFSLEQVPIIDATMTPDVKVNGKQLVYEQDYLLDASEDTITFINLDDFEIDSKVEVNFIPSI
ncbi:MAG: hypothetical protein OYH77_04955 [Pseudomonadota bacterium]|nr:hypothetical protein [Pseudomonadota bacterium]